MRTTPGFADTFASGTIAVSLRQTGGVNGRVSALCNDLYLIAVRMRESGDLGEPSRLRKLILHYLALLEDNCRAAGVDAVAVDNVRFAVVALLDETVLSVPGECRDHWLSQPLQLELFGEALAGEEFYRRLERILGDSTGNTDALEVYYLCLCLGFEGKYRLGGRDERARLIQRVAQALRKRSDESDSTRSGHAQRGETFVRHGVWMSRAAGYVPALLSVLALTVVWVSVVFLSGIHDARVSSAIEALVGN